MYISDLLVELSLMTIRSYTMGDCSSPYSLAGARSARAGLPVSMTRFADTTVSVGSAVSAGVDSGQPVPIWSRPRARMFHAAFASLSASNPHAGHECSRTHSSLSVFTPHDAHSFVVFRGSTATKYVPSRSHLYSSIRRKVPHAADAQLREFDSSCIIPTTFRSSTATKSYSRA